MQGCSSGRGSALRVTVQISIRFYHSLSPFGCVKSEILTFCAAREEKERLQISIVNHHPRYSLFYIYMSVMSKSARLA